jgi:hypothetical protein
MLAIQEAHASILAWETSNKLKEWGTEGLTSQGLLEALQQRAETVCSVGYVSYHPWTSLSVSWLVSRLAFEDSGGM